MAALLNFLWKKAKKKCHCNDHHNLGPESVDNKLLYWNEYIIQDNPPFNKDRVREREMNGKYREFLSYDPDETVNALKSAVVVPIFKTGVDVFKITEKMVTEQLTDFLNSGQASHHPMQFSFRKKHLCYFVEKNLIKTRQWECCRGCIWYGESQCPVGVPQGSILGPLLFSSYVMPLVCPEVKTQMYADDTIIFGKDRHEVPN